MLDTSFIYCPDALHENKFKCVQLQERDTQQWITEQLAAGEERWIILTHGYVWECIVLAYYVVHYVRWINRFYTHVIAVCNRREADKLYSWVYS